MAKKNSDPPDLRELALLTAFDLEVLARRFPPGEPGREWLRRTAARLKNSYARTRGQQKRLICRAIFEGHRKISDLIDLLGFSRREVTEMLAELAAAGYVTERTVASQSRGRPSQWFELEPKGEELFSEKLIR